MALDGPYTAEELVRMTQRGRRRTARVADVAPSLSNSPLTLAPHLLKLRSLRLIGIDPGTLRVGWGVIALDLPARSLWLVDCGCIRPQPRLALKERLAEIFTQLEIALRRTRPHAAALEETFAGVNPKAAIAMGEGRGVALLCLARARLEVLELAPRSIKLAVTGSGAAGKARVAALVAAHLGLSRPPQPEDITDALAAAIALARRGGF